ncbi:MAG: hypothetical protein CMN38_04260 [SAR116 cluster bacterium]|nr:hypothetical protein [SAR116 cluster bacterium]
MTSRPLLISAILHTGFALIVVFGLPMIGRDLPEEMPIARMEIVQTVPETNLIEGNKVSTAKEEQEATVSKKPPPPPPPPPPKPAPPKVSPPAVKPEPAPEPAPVPDDAEAETLPDQPTTEVATLKVPRPTPKPERPPKPKPEEVAKTDTKPAPKPTPPAPVTDSKPTPPAPKPNKSQEVVSDQLNKLVKQTEERADAASGVLQNLADAQVAARDAETARQTRQRKEAAETVNDTLTAVAGNAVKAPPPKPLAKVGLDDIGRIQQHVSRCWSAPVGADKTKVLIVDIFVRVNKDGSVIEARIDDMLRYGIDKTFRSFANRAQQAVVECSPLPIPPNKYDQLKEFIFAFDPRYLTKLN